MNSPGLKPLLSRLLVITWLLNPGLSEAAGSEDRHQRPYVVTEERTPCRDYDELRRPFFGDTHIHTVYSFDANGQDTRNTPRDAYRFARGEKIGLQPYDAQGMPLRSSQLRRPLDFTALTDHAEMFGEIRICREPGVDGYDSDFCFLYRMMPPLMFAPLAQRTIVQRERFGFCGEDGERCRTEAAVVWQDIQAAAEEAYDRTAECSFTSFVAYEWTASVGNGENLHRNVIFRNARVPAYAPSWVETPSAFDLWQSLQRDCVDGVPGCDVLTIPHNSNLSGPGLMFASARLTGPQDVALPVSAEEAALRQRWEPLIEIMQHKGDSECLLGGETTDEACAFEKLPYDSFAGVARVAASGGTLGLQSSFRANQKGMVREALKKGLVLGDQLGENPLKYGIIASTDTHLGAPGLVAEDAAMGHGGAGSRRAAGLPDDAEFNPGGLAVLWAEENSRDALFSAMQRREAYGTSGTRPVVRFFGGWSLPEEMCERPDFARVGYAAGVPMGADLPAAEAPGSPRFAVSAAQDPGTEGHPGTPLQRIQIVKGWVEGGVPREKVFEVAGGENGAAVDVATCTRQGAGAAALCSVWEDPDFDPAQRAFYYARVLENPTCRWSQQLCVKAGLRCEDPERVAPGYEACCDGRVPQTVQERAWTSPIWYTPAG